MSGTSPSVAVIVLAAGAGTRMKSKTPKILHTMAGRSLLGHALHGTSGIDPDHLVVVVSHERERVSAAVADIAAELGRDIAIAEQDEPRGTGDAARVCVEFLTPLAALLAFQITESACVACLAGAGDTRTGLKVLGLVAAPPEFGDHPKVINGCSDLLVEVFGEAGRHARSAVGVSSLPFRTPVEIELVAEID